MKSKRLLAFALLSTVLTGCQEEGNKEESVDSKESSSYEMENGVEQEGETKQFDVGKHMFYVRYAHPDAYEDIGGSIEIPDGYEVFDIENVINCHGVTAAFDV